MNNLTNTQQELVNQLINEFTRINKADEPTDDIFAYIDGAVDSKRKLREELNALNNVREQTIIGHADRIEATLQPILNKYGYDIDYECIQPSDSLLQYILIKLYWGVNSQYSDGRRWETKLYINTNKKTQDGIQYYADADFKVYETSCSNYPTWTDMESLKKYVADQIIMRLKRKV